MLESHRAGEGGDARVLWANIAISLVAGLAAVAIGHAIGAAAVSGGGEMLQLRFYFGERDRDGDGPLDAAVMAACARHGVSAAALLRGGRGLRREAADADRPAVVALRRPAAGRGGGGGERQGRGAWRRRSAGSPTTAS